MDLVSNAFVCRVTSVFELNDGFCYLHMFFLSFTMTEYRRFIFILH